MWRWKVQDSSRLTLAVQYRIALQQHIEDLAHVTGEIKSPTEIDLENKKYVGDLLARITKRVLNVTHNKTEASDILTSLAPFTHWFGENPQEMVEEVSSESYMTEIDQLMKGWKEW